MEIFILSVTIIIMIGVCAIWHYFKSVKISEKDEQEAYQPGRIMPSYPYENPLVEKLCEEQNKFKALDSYTQEVEKINEVLVDRLKGAGLDYRVRRFFAPIAIVKRLDRLERDRVVHIPVMVIKGGDESLAKTGEKNDE